MRGLMFAICCGAALLLFAPQASAAQSQAPQGPAVTDEAPVDLEAERLFCPRRMGGPSTRRVSLRRCDAAAASDSPSFGGDGACAVRYGYRGHRRVHFRPRSCAPLFQRAAASAI